MTEAKAAKKPNPALAKPLQPSNELAAVVGSTPLPRTEVVSKVLGVHQGQQAPEPRRTSERFWRMRSFGPYSAARTR